jgi:hypothetical protein
MIIQTPDILPDKIALVKVLDSPDRKTEKKETVTSAQNLEIQGFSADGHAIFQYTNGDINQTFGVNLKKYLAHQSEDQTVNRAFIDRWFLTPEEKADKESSEGAYIFKPEWRSPRPKLYGKLSEDVIYEKGINMEQWTVTYDDPKTSEQALIKIRFSPFVPELIEFVVELNSIPVNDEKGKDVTVNWKMFNGWDAQRSFWTDSGSLEMEERNIRELNRDDETFAGNMYPVTSAIAMRDFSKNGTAGTQVTIMNDRAQAGSADLSDNSTIEIIQHRRILRDDHKGVEEVLNETDTFDDYGLQVNARYYMQIFNFEKGRSLQRSQQIVLQEPLQYFFIFDFKEKYQVKKSLQGELKSLIELSKDGFTDQGYYKLLPVAKNQIILRMENLADRFDKLSNQTSYVNIEKLANSLFTEVNGHAPKSVKIEEVTIQGTMLETDRIKRSFKWKGVDDGS